MSQMTGHEPVDDIEELLRRYSDDQGRRPRHVKGFTDEGSGRPYLTGGALKFDADGCSVHRTRILVDHDLSPDSVCESDYPRLAVFLAADVRDVSFPVLRDGAPEAVQPFDVEPSPWPRGQESSPAHDVAHASITMITGLSRKQAGRAAEALAATARLDV